MSQSGGRWSRQKPVLRSQCVERSPRGQTRPAPEAAGSALYRSPLRRSSWLECPPRCSDPRPIHLPTAAARSSSGRLDRPTPWASGHAARGRERMGGAGCPCDPPVHGLAARHRVQSLPKACARLAVFAAGPAVGGPAARASATRFGSIMLAVSVVPTPIVVGLAGERGRDPVACRRAVLVASCRRWGTGTGYRS